MEHGKLMKTARMLDRIARIISGFMGVMAIVLVIFAALTLLFGEKMFVPGSITMELGHVKLYLSDEQQLVTDALQMFAVVGLAAGSIVCIVVRMILGRVRRILAPMQEGRPFEAHIPADLRSIAWLSLLNGFMIEAVSAAEHLFINRAYDIRQILLPGAVTKIEYSYTMDFSFVVVFAVILFLSYVFRYGQMLQQEADETL